MKDLLALCPKFSCNPVPSAEMNKGLVVDSTKDRFDLVREGILPPGTGCPDNRHSILLIVGHLFSPEQLGRGKTCSKRPEPDPNPGRRRKDTAPTARAFRPISHRSARNKFLITLPMEHRYRRFLRHG
ncbi:hypothetical protein GJAV_G00237880 [Gymnothorax javanicus]|nr:hypothetical protein GJAV_G00237880 [Gymnothorax javanicus]